MADNTNIPAIKSSREGHPRKRARPNPRGTQALENMQSVFEDQERKLEEAKTEIAELKQNDATETAEFQQREKEYKSQVYRLGVKLEYKTESIRIQSKKNADDRHKMEEKYTRLISAAKAVVESNLKDSGERVGELEGALKDLGAIEEIE